LKIACFVEGASPDVAADLLSAASARLPAGSSFNVQGNVIEAAPDFVADLMEVWTRVLHAATPRDLPRHVELVEFPQAGLRGFTSRWRRRQGWHVAQIDTEGEIVIPESRIVALAAKAKNAKELRESLQKELGAPWADHDVASRRRGAAEQAKAEAGVGWT
jgi:Protein of unknown function (DUF3145)